MLHKFPRFFTGIENREEHIRSLCVSGAYFAISFILLSYTGHAWSTANAWDYGHHPQFNYNGMEVLVGTRGWTPLRIAWVYVVPPLWGLFVSVFALMAFRLVEGTKTHLRTFLFWLSLNGYLLYLSFIVTGIMSGQDYGSKLFTGFVSYYSWVDFGRAEIFGLLTIQLVFSLSYALLLSRPVLQLNHSRLLAAKNNGKPVIFLNVVVVPYLIGIVLVALTTFPMDATYQVIRMFTFFPVLIVMFLGIGLHKAKYINITKGGLRTVSTVGVIILFALVLLSRFGLRIMVNPFW
jgi:hypothetical protein